MSQKRLPKWRQHLLKNVQPFFAKQLKIFLYFLPHDFVKISLACGPNSYQIMYGETFDFQCQRQ